MPINPMRVRAPRTPHLYIIDPYWTKSSMGENFVLFRVKSPTPRKTVQKFPTVEEAYAFADPKNRALGHLGPTPVHRGNLPKDYELGDAMPAALSVVPDPEEIEITLADVFAEQQKMNQLLAEQNRLVAELLQVWKGAE